MLNITALTSLARRYLLATAGALLAALFIMASPDTSVADRSTAAKEAGESGPGAIQWTEVVTPDLNNLESSLLDVEVQASDDVWAVGGYDQPYTVTKGLLLHWDGRAWSQLPPPSTPGYTLSAVSVAGPDDVWAIADEQYSQGPADPVDYKIVRWNGDEWNTLPPPSITGTISLEDIEVVAPDDVWVIGDKSLSNGSSTVRYNLMLHWNGSTWTEYTIEGYGLLGITALASDDIWAVGHAFIHWDGNAWTVVEDNTNYGYTEFTSVAAISEDNVWAVSLTRILCGARCSSLDAEVARWNGVEWTMGPKPDTHAGLNAVTAVGPDDVWAVGQEYHYNGPSPAPERRSVILHWDGVQWHNIEHPVQRDLRGIAAASPNDIWAVGTSPMAGAGPSTDTMAILHYGRTPAFHDVPLGSAFYPYITCLSDLGFVSGFPDGTFRPNDPVTRGQLAKIVANTAGLDAEVPESRQTFADVPPPPAEGSTYWLYVERLYERGVIAGYDCTPGPDSPLPCDPLNRKYYLPNAPVSRGQTSKIVANTVGYDDPLDPNTQTYSDVPPTGEGSTFWPYIERLTARGIMGGYPCSNSTGSTTPCDTQNRPYFRPNADVTRGQAAKIVANTFYPNCQVPARK
jgi:hypothetical protein